MFEILETGTDYRVVIIFRVPFWFIIWMESLREKLEVKEMKLRELIARKLFERHFDCCWGKGGEPGKSFCILDADALITELQKAGYGREVKADLELTTRTHFQPINREDEV